MARYRYIGKANKHYVSVPSAKAGENPEQRALVPGEVIELSDGNAVAFADRFEPESTKPDAPFESKRYDGGGKK